MITHFLFFILRQYIRLRLKQLNSILFIFFAFLNGFKKVIIACTRITIIMTRVSKIIYTTDYKTVFALN